MARTEQLIQRGANTQDAILTAMNIAKKAAYNDAFIQQTVEALHQERTKNQLVESIIFDIGPFIIENCPYKPNPKTKQLLQRPEIMLRDGSGNCMDYSIFFAALCLRLKIPIYLKAISLYKNKPVHHIYPVINGFPLDLVLVQEQKTAVLGQEPANIQKFQKWTFTA